MSAKQITKFDNYSIKELTPYSENPKEHTDTQIEHLKQSIIQFGFLQPIIIDENKTILAGHGRKLAAEQLNMTEVPVWQISGLSESDKVAYRILDNHINQETGFDETKFEAQIKALFDSNFNLEAFGLAWKAPTVKDTDYYSSKITSPVYTPVGKCPKLSDLFDCSQYSEIIKRVDEMSHGLTEPQMTFLKLAAARFVQFNYSNIAEYYAHQNKEIQALMEDSALVIIDYNKAIEKGFVAVTMGLNSVLENQLNEQ